MTTKPPKKGPQRRTPLTAKREAFAKALAAGTTQAEAYRQAFPASRKWAPESVWSRSSALAGDINVQVRVKQLQEELRKRDLWDREDSVRALRSVIDDPDRKTDIVAAVKELNAMHGYHAPTKIAETNTKGEDVGPRTDKERLADLLALVDRARERAG